MKNFQLSFPLTLSCALPWSDTYSVWVTLSQEGALNSKFSWNLWILRKKPKTWDCGKRQENPKQDFTRPKCPSKFVKRPWFKPMEGLVLPVTAFMSFASILWLVVKFSQKPLTIIKDIKNLWKALMKMSFSYSLKVLSATFLYSKKPKFQCKMVKNVTKMMNHILVKSYFI